MRGRADRQAIYDYLTDLQDRKLAPATVELHRKAVRQLMQWLRAEKIIDTDPSEGIPGPVVKPKPVRPFTEAEIAAIRAACKLPHERAIVALLIATGVRVGELSSLTVDRLDLDTQRVQVHGKTGWRWVPFDGRTELELDRYLRWRKTTPWASAPELWVSRRGPMTRVAVRNAINYVGRRAGVEHVHPHRFRHDFADRWLSSEGSEGGLMSIAGWTSRKTMDRYTKARAEDRAADEYRRVMR